ncbi:MAG: DHH family phosphoesterase, partial [Candidatus Methylomirabilia bacterium]
MRSLLICPDDFLFQLFRGTPFPGEPPLYVVRDPAVRARIARRGEPVISGDLEDPATYRRAFRTGTESALLTAPRDRVDRMLAALRAAVPRAPLVVIKENQEPPADNSSGVVTLPLSAFTERLIQPAIERAQLRGRVERIRTHFAAAERVLIMMQDDPDPDAIASALALRTLLGRNKASAPIATFGSVTRPENRAMCRILEIDVEEIHAPTLGSYDRVAMVDAQPALFEQRFQAVDLVVDHHPEGRNVRAFIKDIRPSYGATSTILTDYLRAAEVKITQRLATALLYGIMSDTLHLERGCTRADLDDFTYLH